MTSAIGTEVISYTDAGAFSYTPPPWCDELDIVCLDGGSGGRPEAVAQVGRGGDSGRWTTATLRRDVDFSVDTVFTGRVGAGGTEGSLGGDSFVAGVNLAEPLTQSIAPASRYVGRSPGNITYGGRTYIGGGQQGGASGTGIAPGGGGVGGFNGASPGHGAPGAVWFFARQLTYRTSAGSTGTVSPSAAAAFPVFAPTIDTFQQTGQYDWLIPWWCNAVDVVLLSGGGGGQGGGTPSGWPGSGLGGNPGNFSYRTLIRGRDLWWEQDYLRIKVGGGGGGFVGNHGSPGAPTFLEFLYSDSQRGYNATDVGPGPGTLTYHGVDFVGGTDSVAAGIAPGGAGAGGVYGSTGFPGTPGAAWLRSFQIAGWSTAKYTQTHDAYANVQRTDVTWTLANNRNTSQPISVARRGPDSIALYQARSEPEFRARQSNVFLAIYQGFSNPKMIRRVLYATALYTSYIRLTRRLHADYVSSSTPTATAHRLHVYAGTSQPSAVVGVGTFTVPGVYTVNFPLWAERLELVLIGGGGHGSVGSDVYDPSGGGAGAWRPVVLIAGRDCNRGDPIELTVGGSGQQSTFRIASTLAFDYAAAGLEGQVGEGHPGRGTGVLTWSGWRILGSADVSAGHGLDPGGGGAGGVGLGNAGYDGGVGRILTRAF